MKQETFKVNLMEFATDLRAGTTVNIISTLGALINMKISMKCEQYGNNEDVVKGLKEAAVIVNDQLDDILRASYEALDELDIPVIDLEGVEIELPKCNILEELTKERFEGREKHE